MNELYDSIDYENLNFEYVDKRNNDVWVLWVLWLLWVYGF